MSSGIPSMFKTPRHRSFEYKPRYYDETKERKAELERMVEEQLSGEISEDARLQRLRSKLESRWRGGGTMRKENSAMRSIRLLAVITVLVFLVWLIWKWG